jgi:hypothetical protein
MKNGDLSNYEEATIGFRCEEFVVKQTRKSIFNVFEKFEVDQEVLKYIEYIVYRTNLSVCLVVNADNFTRLKKVLEDIPCRLMLVASNANIENRLLIGVLTYFVDREDSKLQVMNKNVLTLGQLNDLIRSRRI